MNNTLHLIRTNDLKCNGIRYGLSLSEIREIEDRCGKIFSAPLLQYLSNAIPVWPYEEIEYRFVAPQLLDYGTVLKLMDSACHVSEMIKYGYMPLCLESDGDANMINKDTGLVIVVPHENVNSAETARKYIEHGVRLKSDSLYDYLAILCDQCGWR